MGRRYDGGKSPLALPPVDLSTASNFPGYCSPGDVNHTAMPGKWSDSAQKTYDDVLSGIYEAGINSWCDERLVEWGYTPEKIRTLSKSKRLHVCNRLVSAARRVQTERSDEILQRMLSQPAQPNTPGAYIDKMGIDLEQRHRGGVPRYMMGGSANKRERTMLHVSLREWARGELKLEHPQSSSWHHMVSYEATISTEALSMPVPQLFVVERDWARAFAGYDLSEGDSPLPFDLCCFEFRISGVRVLAIYQESYDEMHCIYGRGGVWVCDDYVYSIATGHARAHNHKVDNIEFPRVAKLVRDNVRVACIMIDADIAETQPRKVGEALVAKRKKEGKPPPRDHYVIDLKRRHRHEPRSPGYIASAGGLRAPQRGHFRRGTWVHYHDDRGQVKYTDDKGNVLSRTWRHWHFAGDPNNVIEREYKL